MILIPLSIKKLKHLIHTMISAELTTKKKQWNNFLPLLSWHWFLRLCFFFFEGHCYLLNMISGMRRFKKYSIQTGSQKNIPLADELNMQMKVFFLHIFMLFVVDIVNMIFNKYEQIHKHIYSKSVFHSFIVLVRKAWHYFWIMIRLKIYGCWTYIHKSCLHMC